MGILAIPAGITLLAVGLWVFQVSVAVAVLAAVGYLLLLALIPGPAGIKMAPRQEGPFGFPPELNAAWEADWEAARNCSLTRAEIEALVSEEPRFEVFLTLDLDDEEWEDGREIPKKVTPEEYPVCPFEVPASE